MTTYPDTPTMSMDNNDENFDIDYNLSLYIPSVDSINANLEYFQFVFHNLNLADVKRVDFQPKSDNTYMAFVHMNNWYNNICVKHLQERILNENNTVDARIVHDDPEYWILKKNKNPVPDNYASELNSLKCLFNNQLNYIQSINECIISQNKLIENLTYWVNLHEANIKYLCGTIEQLKSERIVVQAQPVQVQPVQPVQPVQSNDGNWPNRLRKRRKDFNYTNNYHVYG